MSDFVPTDRELEALKVLWQRGPCTVSEICDVMKDQGSELAYTTVLSLLQVMEQKELVRHRKTGKAYVYFPRAERDSTVRNLTEGFLRRVFDGALDEYLVHALRSRTVSADELDRLANTIAEAKARSKRRTGGGGGQ